MRMRITLSGTRLMLQWPLSATASSSSVPQRFSVVRPTSTLSQCKRVRSASASCPARRVPAHNSGRANTQTAGSRRIRGRTGTASGARGSTLKWKSLCGRVQSAHKRTPKLSANTAEVLRLGRSHRYRRVLASGSASVGRLTCLTLHTVHPVASRGLVLPHLHPPSRPPPPFHPSSTGPVAAASLTTLLRQSAAAAEQLVRWRTPTKLLAQSRPGSVRNVSTPTLRM